MSIKDITVVITSFRSETQIRECLKYINGECNVINVDNSDDKEIEEVKKEWLKSRLLVQHRRIETLYPSIVAILGILYLLKYHPEGFHLGNLF